MRLPQLAVPLFVIFSLSGCGGAEGGAGTENSGGGGGGQNVGGGGGSSGGFTTSSGGGTGGTSSAGGGGAGGGSAGSGGTGGGVSACDQAGVCGNTGSDGCVACAVNGPCSDVFDACFANDDCATYETCLAFCDGNPGCIQSCGQEVPAGKLAYEAYEQCVLCDQCLASCNAATLCGN